MAFLMEEDKASGPADIGLFSAVGVVFTAQDITRLVEKFFLAHQTPFDEENIIVMLYFDYIPIKHQKTDYAK